MRLTVFCLLFSLISRFGAYAQHDSTAIKGNDSLASAQALADTASVPDSAAMVKSSREQVVADSLAMIWFRPDPMRENQFLIHIFKNNIANIDSLFAAPSKPKANLKIGQVRETRDPWIIVTIIGLLIYTALLNIFLGKDVKSVIQSFYNKHALSQIDKEGGLINSWAFIGLFVLFSLSFGLVLYQLTIYYHVYQRIDGLQVFIWLSMAVAVLFGLKFLMLKFIGFIFDINQVVSQYIAILNLTYFNIAFVLLFVTICLSLLANQFIPYLLIFTLALIAVIFAWQYVRNSVNIISSFRFHKFYLFIYLCALEICPILILIKALNI